MVSLTWSGALGWRMRRQLLDPVGTESVAVAVRRLDAAQAQCDAAAKLTVRVRRERSRPDEVATPGRGADHQDLGVPGGDPSRDARGGWLLVDPATSSALAIVTTFVVWRLRSPVLSVVLCRIWASLRGAVPVPPAD
jgi:hypothetical protein